MTPAEWREFAKTSTKAARDFAEAMERIQRQAGMSATEVETLSRKVRRLSKQ